MKKLITGTAITLAIVLAFGTGAYAAKNWMSFTGEQAITNTESNIDELLNIMDNLKAEISDSEGENQELADYYETVIQQLQEQFQAQLTNVTNAKDEQIQDLLQQLADADNSDYVEHLESELKRANEVVQAIEDYSSYAVESARE